MKKLYVFLVVTILIAGCSQSESSIATEISESEKASPSDTPVPTSTIISSPTATKTIAPTSTPLPTGTLTPTPTAIPTQAAPFDLSKGTEAWKDLLRIEEIFNSVNVELRYTFEECSSNVPDERELIVSYSPECWKISDIDTFGMDDEDPTTVENDYITTMVFYTRIGFTESCKQEGKRLGIEQTCLGSTYQVDFDSGVNDCGSGSSCNLRTIPESSLGFEPEKIDGYLNSWSTSWYYDQDNVLGVLGLDRKTADNFFHEWKIHTGYFEPRVYPNPTSDNN